jgi:hypothetical protein
MQKWEYFFYRTNYPDSDEDIVSFGVEGWEIISIVNLQGYDRALYMICFKRPLED